MSRILHTFIVIASVFLAVSDARLAAQEAAAAPPADTGPDEFQVAAAQPDGSQAGSSRRRRGRATTYKVIEVKDGGVVTGTVQYMGVVPKPRKIHVVKDHETCKQHPVEVPLMRVDAEHRVGEAVVYLADISAGKDWPKSDAKSTIDQKTCEFHPHVQVVRAKSPVEIVNSDPVAHNINASQRIFTLFNILQPQQGMKATQQFERPGLVNLKCNVHDWMQAYVHVAVHPYIVVTGDDGSFRLEGVPPGKYQLGVWQEYLGEQIFDVEVKPGETTQMDVVLKPKAGEEGTAEKTR
ncbi:MAG: hypothetical protein DCC65_16630 [Planctomycetota bacterium]|nr:MAG: hypothetical protein DCC65_16630 [Planctomycetota bacterium]